MSKRKKELSPDARSLLNAMRDGKTALFRATTGRAYVSVMSVKQDCTLALIELLKRGLVEVESIDRNVGWVVYRAKSSPQGE